jgi:hypothetical protein
LVEGQVTAGGLLKFGEDFVVFHARKKGKRAAWTPPGA